MSERIPPKFIRDFGNHIVGIVDNSGQEWFWIGQKLVLPSTVAEDPGSGYYCTPYDVDEALEILKNGLYIDETSYLCLNVLKYDW